MPTQLLNQDCIAYLKNCGDNFFDLAICDPPYGIGISSNPVRQQHKKKTWDNEIPGAEYFAELGTNERTVIFVAFTGEEMGLLGSKYFGKGIDAAKFMAGINIEMIGKQSSFGPKTAWLTGFDRSDFGEINKKFLLNAKCCYFCYSAPSAL